MESILFLFVFMILMIIKVPVAFSLGLSCIFYFVTNGVPLETVPQIMLGSFESFTLLAIPLFMLAGQIMNMGGVTERLFDFCKKLVGHIPGGLGHVNIVSSLIFAGMSGSATADAAGCPFVFLSAGVTLEAFAEGLELAGKAGVPYGGYLCGRAVWRPAIEIFGKGGSAALADWAKGEGRERLRRLTAIANETAVPLINVAEANTAPVRRASQGHAQ